MRIPGPVMVGKYTGIVAEGYRCSDFLSDLEDIAKLVAAAEGAPISGGRNRNVKLAFTCGGRPLVVAIKSFGRQPLAKDRFDRLRGSKARRAWLAACALQLNRVGTPPPIGYLECWNKARLIESYYLAEHQSNVISFADELIRLFRDDPQCVKFMTLLQCVASAVRAMHKAGFRHNDLGNQNILLRRIGDSAWGDVQFIDLNRSMRKPRLSLRERARDISRIYLPSDLRRVFVEMCHGDVPPEPGFLRWEKFYRTLYAIHAGTRRFRHPIRAFRERRRRLSKPATISANCAEQRTYPSEKDMWIWDERSGQAIAVMKPGDRYRFYPMSRHLRIAYSTLRGFRPVWREYKSLLRTCYQGHVSMKDRVGIAVSPKPQTWNTQLELLRKLGNIPVIIRFYHHESEPEWRFTADAARSLNRDGHSVSIALAQDRRAVIDPERWKSFVAYVLDQVAGYVEWVEVGHAPNRVKWGVWDFKEHLALLEKIAEISAKYQGLRLMGPAVIDFEYPFLMAALENMPAGLRFEALSHLLYVDRRGAPENRQGPFSSLEKFALAKAIARWASVCDDRLIVSEASWPIQGTGVYSPVTSPYQSPGPRFNDPSVTEDDYANYMIRYLAIALCSGMVDRVYWWRLAARGFGLVDDTDPENWRERPAYGMLRFFISLLRDSVFIEKISRKATNGAAAHFFLFALPDNRRVCLAYSPCGAADIEPPFEFSRAMDAMGRDIEGAEKARIGPRPVYLFQ